MLIKKHTWHTDFIGCWHLKVISFCGILNSKACFLRSLTQTPRFSQWGWMVVQIHKVGRWFPSQIIVMDINSNSCWFERALCSRNWTGKALLVGLFSKFISPFSCSFCVLVGAVMSVSMENWLAMETISIDILTAAEASAFFLTCSFVCFFLSTLSPDFFLAVVDRSFCSSFFSFLFSVFFGLVFSFSLVFFFSLVLSTSSFSFRSVFFWGLCSSFWFLTSFFFLGLISLSWILLSFDLAVSILFR